MCILFYVCIYRIKIKEDSVLFRIYSTLGLFIYLDSMVSGYLGRYEYPIDACLCVLACACVSVFVLWLCSLF